MTPHPEGRLTHSELELKSNVAAKPKKLLTS
jgi:hypothetical protein